MEDNDQKQTGTEDTDQKQTGTVKWFNTAKGYGFIAPDGGGNDLFAHVNELNCDPNELREGTKVEFSVTEGRKGPQAVNVALVQTEEAIA